MAVPRRKTSPSRRGMRRSADALKKPTYAEDKDSGELRRPHHLDLKTGMYKGRQVLKAKKESWRSYWTPDRQRTAYALHSIRGMPRSEAEARTIETDNACLNSANE